MFAALFASVIVASATSPFTITDDAFASPITTVHLKVITNTVTGERVSVNTNWGGGVEELTLFSQRKQSTRSVLWTHQRNATAVALNIDWRGRMLIPYGNRIGGAEYKFNHTTYHLPVNDVMPCEPPLVCVNNSLHGLIWNRPLRVLRTQTRDRNASVTLAHDFTKAHDARFGYPFDLHTEITYTLFDSFRGFQVDVLFTNLDTTGWSLPVYNGWHPYFLAHTSASTVTLDPCTSWKHVDVGQGPQYPPPRFSNMVPTGRVGNTTLFNGSAPIGGNATHPTYMDDEVKAMNGECCPKMMETVLDDPVANTRSVLRHESRYLQIWTGGLSTFGIDAVVLEPLSAMSDGFNNHDGLHVLSAGETTSNAFGIRIE